MICQPLTFWETFMACLVALWIGFGLGFSFIWLVSFAWGRVAARRSRSRYRLQE